MVHLLQRLEPVLHTQTDVSKVQAAHKLFVLLIARGLECLGVELILMPQQLVTSSWCVKAD